MRRCRLTGIGFELTLLALAPRTHHLLRRTYNSIGPRLAAVTIRPLAADLAYVALKPAEWIAWLALSVMLGPERTLVRRLYRDTEESEQ